MAELEKDIEKDPDHDQRSVADTVAKNRDLIKKIVSMQYDDIIDDAYQTVDGSDEMEARDPETRKLMKSAMDSAVDDILNELGN